MNKYQEALDNIGSLYMYDEDGDIDCLLSESFMKDDYDILKQLINEHFELVKDFMQLDKYFVQLEKSYDNLYDKFHNLKPLKFENLHDFMPVFDVKTGFWIMITSVTNGDSFGGYVFNKKDATLCFNLFTFEENRFYQREVNNDE